MKSTVVTHKHYKIYYILALILLLLTILYVYLILPNCSRRNEIRSFNDWYFAHRGLHNNEADFPENSLPAFNKAILNGFGIELDVQLTKDYQVIVFHDDCLSRACDTDLLVKELTYDQLQNYTLFNSKEKIPLLTEVLSLVQGQVPLIIEIKGTWAMNTACSLIADILQDYSGSFCIQSFNPLILYWFRNHEPYILRGQLAMAYSLSSNSSNALLDFSLTHLLFNFLAKPDFIAYDYQHVSNLSPFLCQKLFDTPIAVWTLKDPRLLKLYKQKYDIIIFDSFIP